MSNPFKSYRYTLTAGPDEITLSTCPSFSDCVTELQRVLSQFSIHGIAETEQGGLLVEDDYIGTDAVLSFSIGRIEIDHSSPERESCV